MPQHTEVAEHPVTGAPASHFVLPAVELGRLIEALARRGFDVAGPTLRDGAIVYDHIARAEDLPAGWTDEQAPASYRLKRREDQAIFAYVVGPQSWKKYLHPSEVLLCSAMRDNGQFRILNNEAAAPSPYAFLGVRACELQAIAVQDRVLLEDKHRDPIYEEHRHDLFIVSVQCTQSAKTCFCASMGTGPRAQSGFDLALTELTGNGSHRFLVETGTQRGAEVMAELHAAVAPERDWREAELAVDAAAHQQVRGIDTTGLKDFLYQNFEHPRWDDVARRCLACANCTMVCPTCFCTNVEDFTDVTGDHAERRRDWDSCFTLGFSYIHGGNIRNSAKARYRQWLTHKLASWFDQFGTAGCVGCGRCITWCPVGIDLTEEIRAMRETQDDRKP
ncbi:MAG TPA: 4Fe-4S dicluster domain-containing protein [Terriglobales bacterium]|nr:4Fe-4S dicluster domain-containing protein [Terriglobales bacterium]